MKLEPLEMNVVFEPVTEKTGCHRMQTLVRRQRMDSSCDGHGTSNGSLDEKLAVRHRTGGSVQPPEFSESASSPLKNKLRNKLYLKFQ